MKSLRVKKSGHLQKRVQIPLVVLFLVMTFLLVLFFTSFLFNPEKRPDPEKDLVYRENPLATKNELSHRLGSKQARKPDTSVALQPSTAADTQIGLKPDLNELYGRFESAVFLESVKRYGIPVEGEIIPEDLSLEEKQQIQNLIFSNIVYYLFMDEDGYLDLENIDILFEGLGEDFKGLDKNEKMLLVKRYCVESFKKWNIPNLSDSMDRISSFMEKLEKLGLIEKDETGQLRLVEIPGSTNWEDRISPLLDTQLIVYKLNNLEEVFEKRRRWEEQCSIQGRRPKRLVDFVFEEVMAAKKVNQNCENQELSRILHQNIEPYLEQISGIDSLAENNSFFEAAYDVRKILLVIKAIAPNEGSGTSKDEMAVKRLVELNSNLVNELLERYTADIIVYKKEGGHSENLEKMVFNESDFLLFLASAPDRFSDFEFKCRKYIKGTF